VDSQWIIHQSLPSLGSQVLDNTFSISVQVFCFVHILIQIFWFSFYQGEAQDGKAGWQGVRDRCKREWTMFQSRMASSEKQYLKEIANSTIH
jgi:hypothetical protein